ncbi:MAG: esterase/lipase family protein [Arenibacterium sp.]
MVQPTLAAPSRALLLLEGRAIPELFGFAAALPTLTALAPRGDGQPVLVLPGLTTSDRSTVALRRFLKSKGYPTYGWNMGLNLGPRPGVEQGLIDLVDRLADEHGRKISIVGWSLGGIYARQLGKIMPEHVRQVISLGSPFGGHPRATNAWRVYQMASGQDPDDTESHMGGAIAEPPKMPTTAIYSKTDGICAWQNCIERRAPHTENIEVKASHCGLGHHPSAVYAIADRLAQPEGNWKKFERSGVLSLVFPPPAYLK